MADDLNLSPSQLETLTVTQLDPSKLDALMQFDSRELIEELCRLDNATLEMQQDFAARPAATTLSPSITAARLEVLLREVAKLNTRLAKLEEKRSASAVSPIGECTIPRK
jgi:hypothetical protein